MHSDKRRRPSLGNQTKGTAQTRLGNTGKPGKRRKRPGSNWESDVDGQASRQKTACLNRWLWSLGLIGFFAGMVVAIFAVTMP